MAECVKCHSHNIIESEKGFYCCNCGWDSEKEEYAKRMNNADRIRAMNDKELANKNVYFVSEFVAQQGLRYTGLDGHYYRTGAEVVEANMKWLQSEVEE